LIANILTELLKHALTNFKIGDNIQENWHKKLRDKYAGDSLAEDISAKSQELGEIAWALVSGI